MNALKGKWPLLRNVSRMTSMLNDCHSVQFWLASQKKANKLHGFLCNSPPLVWGALCFRQNLHTQCGRRAPHTLGGPVNTSGGSNTSSPKEKQMNVHYLVDEEWAQYTVEVMHQHFDIGGDKTVIFETNAGKITPAFLCCTNNEATENFRNILAIPFCSL